MESLDGTEWDVVIAGTGLQESLLALALSRSGKRVLHVDKHNYYGGADASLSLQEAKAWADESDPASVFADKSLEQPALDTEGRASQRLSFSRAYSLALAPQIIYSRSTLLPALVSSRVDTQLEFLAVGSWWVYSSDTANDPSGPASNVGTLERVPSGREDIFADPDIEARVKRALMKFLRFLADYENQSDAWHDYADRPLSDFLLEKFALPPSVQQPITALALISAQRSHITTSAALPRIARHLRSIGVFGPGFGAVIPKWGGLSEIAQIGCRAGAVGGGVYVLGNGLEEVTAEHSLGDESSTAALRVKLKNGTVVSTHNVIASQDSMPGANSYQDARPLTLETACRSICIVSSSLTSLFPRLAEGGPSPAAAVVVFPGSSISSDGVVQETPQVFITVHSSDTGECPSGQCVLYSSVTTTSQAGFTLLDDAVSNLLKCVNELTRPTVLWKLQYTQRGPREVPNGTPQRREEQIILFPPPSLDLAFDDGIMERVKSAWRTVMGGDVGDFMQFPAREDLEVDGEEEY